jgi:hypothetical protein
VEARQFFQFDDAVLEYYPFLFLLLVFGLQSGNVLLEVLDGSEQVLGFEVPF